MERPLIPLLFAFMVGVAIGNFYQIADLPLLISLFITLMLLLLSSVKKSQNLVAFFLIISFTFLGILNINLYLYHNPGPNHISHHISRDKATVEGLICENPQVSTDRTELTVATSRLIRDEGDIPVNGLVLLSVDTNQEFNYGDFVRFKTRLRAPQNFKNPGGFDYAKHLRYKGIMVRGTIHDPSGIIIVRERQGNILKTRLERFRESIKKLIKENAPSPEGEIIQAMILGNQREIPKEVMENFNKTGTTHIIAISGFNIGIIAFLSFMAVRLMMNSSTYLLLRFNIIKVSTIFGIIPVIIYTFIAGLGISVIRASIMAVTFMIAIILGKERDLYNSLALAALIIIVISPYSLFDVSFQLSFVAVWAILFITPKLSMMIPGDKPEEIQKHPILSKKIFRNILIFIIVSLSATLGTLPLIIFYFNRVSTVVLLSNLVVVPVMGVIAIPVCMAIIIAAPFSHALALIFLNISSFLVGISVSMVDFFASLPGSSFFVSTPSLLEIAAYYLFLILSVQFLDIRKTKNNVESDSKKTLHQQWFRISLAALAVFIIIDATYVYTSDKSHGKLTVTFIDVGQGNAALIKFPGGKKFLIDGGGTYENIFDIGKYVIAPFLWHERIQCIDVVVLTHPHPDHLNGLNYILSNFDVKEVWTNGETAQMETFDDFLRIIKKKNIPHRLISKKSGVIRINDVTITIVNPVSPIDMESTLPRKFDNTNNDSIVMKLTLGKVSMLLPADISETSERRIVESDMNIKSQILLVPHHGGFTSSTIPFLDRVEPSIAVVSCGRNNVYNDPHPDVVRRYGGLGTKILRTDINGAVSITTDGANISSNVFRQ